MLAAQFGDLIKAERARKGMKQSDLARSAKVSRTVLSRLELGTTSAVQTNVLDRILEALEVRPRLVDRAEPDDARKQARLEHQQKLEQRRNRHLRLAIDLADDGPAARAKISKAGERDRKSVV